MNRLAPLSAAALLFASGCGGGMASGTAPVDASRGGPDATDSVDSSPATPAAPSDAPTQGDAGDAVGLVPDAAGPTVPDAGRHDASNDGPSGAWTTVADLPECVVDEPSFECVQQLFVPLSDGGWPFDTTAVGEAFGNNGFGVAPGWRASALHVLESLIPVGVPNCYFDEFTYATAAEPIQRGGCGQLLFAGGHPQAVVCRDASVPMSTCADRVPIAESFDVAAVAAPEVTAVVPVAAAPGVGEFVFLVGTPGFPWLPVEQQRALAEGYPLVSVGRVVAIEGTAIVTDAMAFGGSSGGPLLDASGAALGVASTLVGHVRAQGIDVPARFADHMTVVTAFDARMREVIAASQ